MSRHGVIDLGSNTIRLCIYEVKRPTKGPIQKSDISTLLNYKVMAGLASFVRDGVMQERGIKKAIRVISEHCERAACMRTSDVQVFATAVLRNCANSAQATKAIERGCGMRINLLSNEEEAHLGFLGANLCGQMKNGTMVDIGGGSTELTVVQDGKDSDGVSLPQGSLSSFASHVKGLMPTPDELACITEETRGHLSSLDAERYRSAQLYGIGGSVRVCAKLYGDLCSAGERLNFITPYHTRMLLAAYADDPDMFAHKALQTAPDRIHTLMPGIAILNEVFAFTEGERLDICKHGVREGFLVQHVLGNASK